MNEQKKEPEKFSLAGKLNFFDIFLIILLALLIFAGAALFLYGSRNRTQNTVIEYTVLVKELPADIHVMAEPGQTVVDTVKLGTIGEVVSYEITPSVYDELNQETLSIVHGEYDDLVNAAFTIRSEAVLGDACYMIGSMKVSVGAAVYFRTPYFTGYGYVTDLHKVSAQQAETQD